MKKIILFILIWQCYVLASESQLLLPQSRISMSVNSDLESPLVLNDLSIKSLEELTTLKNNLQLRKSAILSEYADPSAKCKIVGKASVPPLICTIAGGVIGAMVCGYPPCNDVALVGFMVSLPGSLYCIQDDYRYCRSDNEDDESVKRLAEDIATIKQAIKMKKQRACLQKATLIY